MVTALGIAPDINGNGVDDVTHRRILEGHWEQPGVIRTSGFGNADQLKVKGTSGLTYAVNPGNLVYSRSATNGVVEAFWPGGNTPPVAAGDANYPRIDTIWISAHDLRLGDPDNQVTLGVTSGTPAYDPMPPNLHEDEFMVAQMLVPAGMTQTTACSSNAVALSAIPYATPLGLIARNVRNYEGTANYTDAGKDYFEQETQFTLNGPRTLELRFSATACACKRGNPSKPTDTANYTDAGKDYFEQETQFTLNGPRTLELRFSATACACKRGNPSKPTDNATDMACWYVGLQLDGKDIDGGGGQFQVSRAWEPVSLNVIVTVPAGTHTVRTRNHRVTWGENVYFICHSDAKETYRGRVLEIWDRGPANML